MKANFLCVILVMASFISVSGQKRNGLAIDGIFAGKPGVNGKTGGNYTVEELRKSDWILFAADTNFTVTEFKMSLVFKHASSLPYAEYYIKGNTIPESYRDKILNQAAAVYLEYIQATNARGVLMNVKPIAIRIQS